MAIFLAEKQKVPLHTLEVGQTFMYEEERDLFIVTKKNTGFNGERIHRIYTLNLSKNGEQRSFLPIVEVTPVDIEVKIVN